MSRRRMHVSAAAIDSCNAWWTHANHHGQQAPMAARLASAWDCNAFSGNHKPRALHEPVLESLVSMLGKVLWLRLSLPKAYLHVSCCFVTNLVQQCIIERLHHVIVFICSCDPRKTKIPEWNKSNTCTWLLQPEAPTVGEPLRMSLHSSKRSGTVRLQKRATKPM